jgi:hypothetical protein
MPRLSDNNPPNLNRLDGIRLASDAVDRVPQAPAGAHTPEHLQTTSSTASATPAKGIDKPKVVTQWK